MEHIGKIGWINYIIALIVLFVMFFVAAILVGVIMLIIGMILALIPYIRPGSNDTLVHHCHDSHWTIFWLLGERLITLIFDSVGSFS